MKRLTVESLVVVCVAEITVSWDGMSWRGQMDTRHYLIFDLPPHPTPTHHPQQYIGRQHFKSGSVTRIFGTFYSMNPTHLGPCKADQNGFGEKFVFESSKNVSLRRV